MRCLIAATAAAAILAGPAMAQWGGGDGAQAGATAWCAARAAGKTPKQASRAASNALVNSMGGNFSANIATIITGGGTMRDSLEYLIRKECPEYVGGGGEPRPVVNSALDDPGHPSFCTWNPWASECMNAKEKQGSGDSKSCDKVLRGYDCSYEKYLSANKSIENWAKLNPEHAKKEAVRLGAADANSIVFNAGKKAITQVESAPGAKDIESKCLKAVDYKGCMEYNQKK